MANNSVSVISQITVRCANETSWTALESPFPLGPLDLVSPGIPIAVVFVYKQATEVEIIPVERLQRTLTLLLDYYPHLTGRLQVDPNGGTDYITHLGTGAELFVARCSERLESFSSPEVGRVLLQNLPDAGNALFAPFDPSPEGVARDPMFTVQHTRFACGAVALGVRVLHILCDADGIFQLVHDLAELYRGLLSFENDPTAGIPSLARPPHIKSYTSGGDLTPEERQGALAFQPSLFYLEPSVDAVDALADTIPTDGSVDTTASSAPPPAPTVGRFLRFSSSELKSIKARATSPNASDGWISTFDALSAHLYQRVHRARMQLHAQNPSHGALSVPNFLTPGPLWQVAEALDALTRVPGFTSSGELQSTVRWLAAQPGRRRIRQGFSYGNGSLMLSQWNKFDMYGDSVLEAVPVLVSTPYTPISLVDGLGYFLPIPGPDAGAIDVNLALSGPVWEFFDRDEPIE
ncbi:transferase family-domain-containing protein [Mycena epipterygia]|nr:transferase family-domain-containing protein [Mycena epipterygia]